MSDILYLAIGLGTFVLFASTREALAASEGTAMVEPLIGLVVALALCIYLVITLIRPERF